MIETEGANIHREIDFQVAEKFGDEPGHDSR